MILMERSSEEVGSQYSEIYQYHLVYTLLALSIALQGINTAPFDTAEFEVVKSRRELQKERKEQRDMEERAAALRAQREAAAARKAAQQAAREQRQAQRELARAEARKAEVQVKSMPCMGV